MAGVLQQLYYGYQTISRPQSDLVASYFRAFRQRCHGVGDYLKIVDIYIYIYKANANTLICCLQTAHIGIDMQVPIL